MHIREISMYQINFKEPIHIYFIGIGGISMSGLAEILLSEGFTVSGSDRMPSPLTSRLEQLGAAIYYGQQEENITPQIDLVVYTSAIKPDNPEMTATCRLQIPSLTRAQLLGQMMKNYKTPIAISGTHGKTTTTSMISQILLDNNDDPTLSIGGIYKPIGGNIRVGSSEHFVTEACEYTNSFLSFYPRIGIILNIEEDHLDYFKDLQHIRRSFHEFASLLPADGSLIISGDIPHPEEITEGLDCKIITFGSSSGCDYRPEAITYDASGCPSFYLMHKGEKEDLFSLQVPGEHNVYNALAAACVGTVCGMELEEICRGIETVEAISGRSNLIHKNGITVIDDCYNANPVSMRASIDVLSQAPGRKIAVLGDMGELGEQERELHAGIGSYAAAKQIDWLFAVGELSKEMAKAAKAAANPSMQVFYFESKEELLNALIPIIKKGDTLLVKASHFMEFPKIVEVLTDLT